MKTCCLIGAEFWYDTTALQKVLEKELREAIVEGEFHQFLISDGNTFDGVALNCLRELREEFPFIKIIVTIQQETFEKINSDSELKKYFQENYSDVDFHVYDLANHNYKFRPFFHYQMMIFESDFVLYLLPPNDNHSFEYKAIKKIKENQPYAYNIYDQIKKTEPTLEGIVGLIMRMGPNP